MVHFRPSEYDSARSICTLGGTGFSLWGKTWKGINPHRLKPVPLKQKAAPRPRSRLFEFETRLVCWRRGRRCRGCLLRRQDADVAPILAFVLEKHDAVNQGEERIVFAAGDVYSWLVTRAALTDQNCSRMDHLAAESLHAEPLSLRIAAVYGGAATLLMCHLNFLWSS